MEKQIDITCLNTGKKICVNKGSNAWDLALRIEGELGFRPLAVKINNRDEDLAFDFFHPMQVQFLGMDDNSGIAAYMRSLTFMISAAVDELYPGSRFQLRYSVSSGYYCKLYLASLDALNGTIPPKEISVRANQAIEECLPKIRQRVEEFSARAIPFECVEEETAEAIKKFDSVGRRDVSAILSQCGRLYTTYYRMGEHIDFFYAPLVHDTGEVRLFGLEPYINGLLLRLPDMNHPERLAPFMQQGYEHKIFEDYAQVFLEYNHVFQNYIHWNRSLGLPAVSATNEAISSGHISELIKLAETFQEKRIGQIADAIAERKGVKVVLIAGPSSSGKTTFSKRLSVQLAVNGLHPIAISLDDYFVERDETPRDENGVFDFESFYALDLQLFNDHLKRLLAGERVNIPTFNFTKGGKEYHEDKVLQLRDNDILVLEGIHALNPDLLPDVPQNVQFKIFASVLTTLLLDCHNCISITDNRLLRRIVRDSQYRGIPCRETLDRWQSVRAGEEKWILPFQGNADAVFNSVLLFELSVLKPFVEPQLRKVPQDCPEYAEAKRLLHLLRYLLPIRPDEIPFTSLLREFVGGSTFRY